MPRPLHDYYLRLVTTAKYFTTDIADIEEALNGPDRNVAAAFLAENGRRHAWFRFHVDRGDRCRDARQWMEGFAAYRAGLDILPLHGGYFVQAGHCLKELGRFVAAEGYYRSGLILGAPISDVEEHLLHVSRHSQNFLDTGKIRQLAAAARETSPEMRWLPTLDDLEALAVALGVVDHVDIHLLVGLMREGLTRGQAADRMAAHSKWPLMSGISRSPAEMQRRIDPLALPRDKGFNYNQADTHGANGAIAAPFQNGHRDQAPSPGPTALVRDSSATPGKSSRADVSTADVYALANSFARNQHDTTAPAFFGAVPQRADDNNVSLDTSAAPEISVIILNYNGSALSLLAAGSVLANRCLVAYEIIIVDNGSNSEQVALLESSKLPVRLVRLIENRGFGEGNNIGVEAARGSHLLFLNSDAFLEPGAIMTMLSAFDAVDDCGAVGAILRYPNGSMQEAGAFVWHDGSTQRRGRGDESFDATLLPAFDVADYVSAACLLIPRATFASAGGFQPIYDPAYCEDVDLCLRLRRDGKFTVVARDATCFHVENATMSADGSLGSALALASTSNQRALMGVWGRYLESRNATDFPVQIPHAARATNVPPDVVAYVPGPFRPHAVERYLLALAGAMRRDGSVVLAAPERWSHLRLRNIQTQTGLESVIDRSISAKVLAQAPPPRLLAMADGDLTALRGLPAAGHTTLVCAAPRLPEGAPRGIEHLVKADRIVVPSKSAKTALLATLKIPASVVAKIAVVPPEIPAGMMHAGSLRRQPLVLSVGPIGDPGADGRFIDLVNAFARTKPSFRKSWNLMLCGDIVDFVLADKIFGHIRKVAADADIVVDVLVSPPLERLAGLYRQSAVYVQATGCGAKGATPTWQSDLLGTGIMTAAVAGCHPIAWHIGAGAEVLDILGAGETFSDLDQLVALLERCDTTGLDPNVSRQAVTRFGETAFAAAARTAMAGASYG